MSKRRLSLQEIRKRIFAIYGDMITIPDQEYVSRTSNMIAFDKEFGEFQTSLNRLLNGTKHPQRYKNHKHTLLANKHEKQIRVISPDIIQSRIKNNFVRLDESTFVSLRVPARFIDSEYGEWWACPSTVIRPGSNQRHPRYTVDSRKYLSKNSHKFKNVDSFVQKLSAKHPEITLSEDTFQGLHKKAEFIHSVYGAFSANPATVLRIGYTNKEIAKEKRKQTCLKRFNATHPCKNPIVSKKRALSANNRYINYHWETGEELVCQGSYEHKTILWLNANKIRFKWQPFAITFENKKTYHPDLYLEDSNTWVEIKGLMRQDALEKWTLFQSCCINCELWDKRKLKELGIL